MDIDHYEGTDLPYAQKLRVIREVMGEEVMGFPYSCCRLGSRLIREFVGLERVVGRLKEGRPFLHEMNRDSELEIYVGVTEDQIVDIKTEITVIPFESDRFVPLKKGERNYTKNLWKSRFLTSHGRKNYRYLKKLCGERLRE